MKKIIIYLSLLTIFACQPIDKFDEIVFDNQQLSKFNIFSKTININKIFEEKISDLNIGHTLDSTPDKRVVNWVNSNFKAMGNENSFEINILDATLTKKEIANKNAKQFDEKIIYQYEIFYLLEYSLYDDLNNLIKNILVESTRTTTSAIYISIQEQEIIVNDLIYLNLVDLSIESKKLLLEYMNNYIF